MSNATPKSKAVFFISLRVKLLLIFTFTFSVLYAPTVYWFYSYSTNNALARVRGDLEQTLTWALKDIDGDQFQKLIEQNGYQALQQKTAAEREKGFALPEAAPIYRAHQQTLTKFHEIEPRAYPYTYVKGFPADQQILFVGDSLRVLRPDNSTLLFEPYNKISNMVKGFVSLHYMGEIYNDDWGSWVSAYAPIKNSAGEVVGALGIDFEASYVEQVQSEVRQNMIIFSLITYAFLIIAVVWISSVFTGPVRRLTRAAERVGEGDYAQDFSSLLRDRLPDEIDILANVFASMVGKIYHREQDLRHQVELLKIEVDETKRQKAVSEIVDSDFFRDLQVKAQDIRQRRTLRGK